MYNHSFVSNPRKLGAVITIFFVLIPAILACNSATPTKDRHSKSATKTPQKQKSTAAAIRPTQSFPPTEQVFIPTQSTSEGPTLLWKTEKPFKNYLIAGDRIIISYEKSIAVNDIQTGRTLWESDTTGEAFSSDQDSVYISIGDQRIDAVNLETGKQTWRALINNPITKPGYWSPTLEDKQNFYITMRNNLQGYAIINKATGKIEIKPVVLTPSKFNEGILLNKGMDVYNLKDGTKLYHFLEFPSSIEICIGKFVYSYEKGGQRYVVAADPQSGSIIWQTTIDKPIETVFCPPRSNQLNLRYANNKFVPNPPTLSYGSENFMIDKKNSGLAYIFLANIYSDQTDPRMMGLDLQTGNVRWITENPTGFSVFTRNAYLWLGEIDGLTLLSHRGFGITEAHNAADFKLIWENANLVLDRLLSTANNTLVGVINPLNSDKSEIVGLDKQTGKQLWTQSFDRVKDIGLANGWVVLFQYNEAIFLNPSTGEEVARVSGKFSWGGKIYEGDRFIIVSGPNSDLHVFNTNN